MQNRSAALVIDGLPLNHKGPQWGPDVPRGRYAHADRALAAGAHEGVLKGSGRMIVGSVSAEVYRRIEEHVRKGAGAPDASKSDDAAAAISRKTRVRTKQEPTRPCRAIDQQTRPGQRARRLGCASGRFVRGREILGEQWRAVRLVARHHRRIDKTDFIIRWPDDPKTPPLKIERKHVAILHPAFDVTREWERRR